MRFQFIDLSEKGISPGELRAVARAVERDALIDADSARCAAGGLAHIDHDAQEEILKDPLLLRTPAVRDGARSVVGPNPDAGKDFLGS